MRALLHPTPKRTILFSNSPSIGLFSVASRLKKFQLAAEVATTDAHVSKSGKRSFKGNKNLKATQRLVSMLGRLIYCLFDVASASFKGKSL